MTTQFTNNQDLYQLAETIGAYSDEAYTNARKLSGTGVVSSNSGINTDVESFIGQVRWMKPLNPVINIASLDNAAAGTKTHFGTDMLRYVKTVRTHGAEKVNMAQIVTKEDGLAKVGRDFAETRAQDEHNALLSVMKGVAISEALNGAAAGSGSAGLGGQTFDNDPTDKRYGFYVDLGANKLIADATTTVQGAARAEGFVRAMGMAFKDYEPDYAYLVVSPEVLASLRSANLVDQDRVTDGSLNFNTIFQGKLRLIQTRATTKFSTTELNKLNSGAGVDIVGSKTSFIVLPGSIALQSLMVPDDVEITRDGNTYNGGGSTSIWYRWGYVAAPAGYDWVGYDDRFTSDADYMAVNNGTVKNTALSAAGDGLTGIKGNWGRKSTSALSLGILPVFHG